MGIKLIVEVMDHAPPELTAMEWKALVILAEDANDATRKVWHGIESEHLLARLGISAGRWANLRVSMVRKGVLEQTRKAHRGSRAEFRIARLAKATQASLEPEEIVGELDAESAAAVDWVTEPVTQSDPVALADVLESLTGTVTQSEPPVPDESESFTEPVNHSPAMPHGTCEASDAMHHGSDPEYITEPVRLSAVMGHGFRDERFTETVTPTPQEPPLLKPPPPPLRWRAAPLMTTVPPATAEEEEEDLIGQTPESAGRPAEPATLDEARALVAALPKVMRPGPKHVPELAAALGPFLVGGWSVTALAARLAESASPNIRVPVKYLLTCLEHIDPDAAAVPRAYCERHPATFAAACGTCRSESAVQPDAPHADGVPGIEAFRRAREARRGVGHESHRQGEGAHAPAAG
jgi:hypothetical protein